jgi:hypothetical protein
MLIINPNLKYLYVILQERLLYSIQDLNILGFISA